MEKHTDLPDQLRNSIQVMPHNDERLAAALANANVVIGEIALYDQATEVLVNEANPKGAISLEDPELAEALQSAEAVITNIPVLEDNAAGNGIVSPLIDKDGVVRSLPMAVSIGGIAYPTLATEILRVANGADQVRILGDGDDIEGIGIGDTVYRTASDGTVRPHFRHSNAHHFISAIDVLNGAVSSTEFANQIVLIGVTGIDPAGSHSTPLSSAIHNVETQAQVLENLLSGTQLSRPGWAVMAEAASLAIMALCLILFMPSAPPWKVTIGYCGLVIVLVAIAHYAFIDTQILLDPMLPSFFSALIFIALYCVILAETERRRRSLRITLQNKRIAAAEISGELRAAKDIQHGMLPDTTNLSGLPDTLKVYASLESAREVGGDFYDTFMIDENRLLFLIGDVTGKGIPASLFMALSKSISKNAVLRAPESSLDAVIDCSNTEISRDNPAALFVTKFAGIIDGRNGHIEFCNAGHENPYIVSDDGNIRELVSEGGPPLCVMEGYPYPAEKLTLLPGETLVLFTDGASEAKRDDGTLYGKENLMRALSTLSGKNPRESADALIADVRRFEDGAKPTDDLTVIALRYNPDNGS